MICLKNINKYNYKYKYKYNYKYNYKYKFNYKYKSNIFILKYKKIKYNKKMKLEEFKGKPKRKYIRKVKESETNNLNTFLLNNENNHNNTTLDNNILDDNNMLDDSNILDDLDNEINQNLSKSIKRMKLNPENNDLKPLLFNLYTQVKKEENIDVNSSLNIDINQNNIELLSTINRIKPTKVEKVYYNPNVMNVKDYEFISPINVYLYYVSEKIGKNITKYIIYTHMYKKIDHHILCSTSIPPNYNASGSIIKKEEIIMLAPNVTLYVREYTQSKRNYTYENCEKSLCKKRKKEMLDYGFDYDFCQLYLERLVSKHKNSYIFEYENKYFMFNYDIYDIEINNSEIKLLTNGE